MDDYKNILVVVKHDPNKQDPALQCATEIAKANSAKITVQLVLDDTGWDLAVAKNKDYDFRPLIEQHHKERLEKMVEPLRKSGLQVETLLSFGKKANEAVRQVVRHKHDLVVKTSRSPTHDLDVSFGSADIRLLRQCPCPVCIVHPGAEKGFSRVMAAVDPEEDKERNQLCFDILRLGSAMAKRHQAEFHVVHAWEAFGESLLKSRLPPQDFDSYKNTAQNSAKAIVDNLLKGSALKIADDQIHMVEGVAHRVIPNCVKENEVDLLVMGTIARSGLGGLCIGNTAEKTLRRLECSLLALKPDDFKCPID